MLIDVLDLSKYILLKSTDDGYPLSQPYLQEILYWCQYEHLKQYNKVLFPETFAVWEIGLIIELVYYSYCGTGFRSIMLYDKELDYNELITDENVKKMIDKIIEQKRIIEPMQLIQDRHNNKVFVKAKKANVKHITINNILYDINFKKFFKRFKNNEFRLKGVINELISNKKSKKLKAIQSFLEAKCKIQKVDYHKIQIEVARYKKSDSLLCYSILLYIYHSPNNTFTLYGRTIWGEYWNRIEFADEESLFTYIKLTLDNKVNCLEE